MMISTRRLLLASVLAIGTVAAAAPASAQDALGDGDGVTGAGSTFLYPVLSRWSREYRSWQQRGGDFPTAESGLDDPRSTTLLQYEPVGSLAGTLRVRDRAVDFGASDMPLASGELATLGLVQFPIAIGGVVVAFNVPGIGSGDLKLTGPVIADIFLKKIVSWSDPAIAALNPGLTLPAAAIVVVHRSDGSGTTFNFTDYLCKVSPEWKLRVGSGLHVAWPTGTAAKGNDGVAQTIASTANTVGYVDHAQAQQLKLRAAHVRNRAGRFVRPDPASFEAAAASAAWSAAAQFHLLLTDGPGDGAWPITATAFVLMPGHASRTRTRATLEFFRWTLDRGGSLAAQLGYVPLPASLVKQVKDSWSKSWP